MGSGSGGGGGGGGGGSASGGSGYSVSNASAGGSRLVSRTKDEIGASFDKLLEGPPKEYYLNIFASDLARDLYAALLDVSVSLGLDRDWQAIQDKYRVPPDAGCLSGLKEAMVEMHGGDDADPLVREICDEALESFFIYAMGDRPSVYSGANADEVFQKINRKVLIDSRSSYFLREMIHEVAKRRSAELTSELRNNLDEYSLKRADRIIRDFDTRFKDPDPQMTHNKIFQVIRENPDWFLNLLKKDAP
jgi:hypothetical protein